MKPTNPMAQLQQWKANHQQGKINQFVNEMNRVATSKRGKNCETDRQFAKVQKANLCILIKKRNRKRKAERNANTKGNYHSTH